MRVGGNPETTARVSPESLEAFQKFFKGMGHRLFGYSHLHDSIQNIYSFPQYIGYLMIEAFCEKIGKPDLSKKCVIEYIDHTQFQAYAATQDGHHFVAISSALPVFLQALFQNLVRTTSPFSGAPGDSEETQIFPDSFESKKYFRSKINDEILSLVSETLPAEKWERNLATKLAELAIVFCIAHELGHIVRGHGSIRMQSRTPHSELLKTGSIRHRRVLQAWEIQADRTAIAFMYSYAINNYKYRRRLVRYLKCDKRNDSVIEIMSRVMYAVSFVFFLMGQQQYDVKSLGSHPSALTRQTFVMVHISALLASKWTTSPEGESERAIQRAADFAEHAWNRSGYEFGNFTETIEDLPSEILRLNRADNRCLSFFGRYHWSPMIR